MNLSRNAKVRQLVRYAREALKNSISLLGDAIVLYESGSNGSAYFVATIAIEEIGKFIMTNDILFNLSVNDHQLSDTIKWLRLTFEHQTKQGKFARETVIKYPLDFINSIINEEFERKKQRALYVDIELKQSQNLLKVTTPKTINEAKARRQISIAHEGLLDTIKGAVEEYYIYEVDAHIAPLDNNTLKMVSDMWQAKYKYKKANYWTQLLKSINTGGA